MENQTHLCDEIGALFQTYKQAMPGLAEAYEALPAEAYADGALPARYKRIMAMAAAVVAGCRGCVLHQARYALDQGATAEELLEACGVAISLGGTMAAAETTRVVAYLQEQGLMPKAG
jgi:AhpD family alkylhydroperoxidase